jgi:type IV pilus assembly protein PilW
MRKPNSSPSRQSESGHRQAGVSLIELMIALAISLVLTAVIGYTYLGSNQVFRSIDAAARLQESARFAFEEIGMDARMASFAGCTFQSTSNVLNNSTDWDKNIFGQPIRGFEDSTETFPNPAGYPADIRAAVIRGDALILLKAGTPSCTDGSSGELIITSHNPPSAQFAVNFTGNAAGTHCIKPGTILLACGSASCSSSGTIALASAFQMSGPSNNNNTASTIVHNTGTGSPGNADKCLGPTIASPSGTCTSHDSCQYTSGKIFVLESRLYYIATNPHGEPALYRRTLGESGGAASTFAEELVEGVENMQITYGVDAAFTDADGDGIDDTKEPTLYVTADQISTAVPSGANITSDEDRWKQVRTLRISLLMVSRQDENITTATQNYSFGGNPPPTVQPTVIPTDRRLRKVFTTVIAVRNRL